MLRGHLRHITLAAISGTDLSGYDLMKNSKRSLTKTKPGSIYPVLSELEDSGLIKVRADERKKVYSDYCQRQEELSTLKKGHAAIIDSMDSAMKMCAMLTGEESRLHQYIVDAMRKGENPFSGADAELRELKKSIMKAASRGIIKSRSSEVRKIISEASRKIKDLEAAR